MLGSRSWLAALLVVPPLAAFLLGSGQVGIALGCATAAAILVVAVRARPDRAIEIAEPGPGVGTGVLIVALAPIEDPRTAAIVAAIADPERPEAEQGALVLAPAKSSLLNRWADDLEQARFESQRLLTVSVATLAAAGVDAEGRVGDGDPLQAVEDTLRSYAATEVVVVAPPEAAGNAIGELEQRLEVPLRRVATVSRS